MAKTKREPKKKLTAAEQLLASKRRLIGRLRDEIASVRGRADEAVAKIEGRIRIAQALVDALEKGTLKP